MGSRRYPCSARSRVCPLGHPAPSRTLSPLCALRLTRAPVPRRPSSSRSRIALLRARACGLSRGSIRSRTTRLFASTTRLGASGLGPRALDRARPRLDVIRWRGRGKLDHLASQRPGRAARAALVLGRRSPWERRTLVIPVVIDRCQQPTILFSRPAPFVPAHSTRCSHTSRWLALHGATASLGVRGCITRAFSSLAASPRVPSMLRHPRDPRRNATRRVHRRRPRPSHTEVCSSSGQPPDGLDLRHRVA